MPQRVVKFIANDGRMFDDQESAEQHEYMLMIVQEIKGHTIELEGDKFHGLTQSECISIIEKIQRSFYITPIMPGLRTS